MKNFFVIALLTISGFGVSTLSLATSNEKTAEDISGSYCYKTDDVTSRLELYSDGECAYKLTNGYEQRDDTGTYTFDGSNVRIIWSKAPNKPEHGTYSRGLKNRAGYQQSKASITVMGYKHEKGCK
jgi:hypothetical protein